MKYLPIFLIIALFSCKNNSPSTSTRETEKKDSLMALSNTPEKAENSKPMKEIKPDSSLYTMVIMFYSIGEGIDFESLRAYEDSISAFSSRIGKNIEYQKTPWGREGETDLCMQLFELSDVEKAQFISQTKMQLKKSKWVNIFENYPCKHKKRTK
jgi:hypothetical protein